VYFLKEADSFFSNYFTGSFKPKMRWEKENGVIQQHAIGKEN
jgi:hypothetical protein